MWKLCLLLVLCASSVFADNSLNETIKMMRARRDVGAVGLFVNANFDNGYGIDVPTSYPNVGTINSALFNGISSIIVDSGCLLTVFTGTSYTGTCWTFGSGTYPSMSAYGLNDNIESVINVNAPFFPPYTSHGVVLYEDANFLGKSIIVGSGNYNSITNAAIGGCGNFGNDALSSYMLMPFTKVTFYTNANRSNPCGIARNYVNNTQSTYGTSGFPMVCPNDSVSSLDVGYCGSSTC